MICLTHRNFSFTDDPAHLKSNPNDIKTTKQTEKNQVHSEPSEFQIALESLGPKAWETRLWEPPNVALLMRNTTGW